MAPIVSTHKPSPSYCSLANGKGAHLFDRMTLEVLVRTRMNEARRELLAAFVALRRRQIDIATVSAVRSRNALKDADRALSEIDLGEDTDTVRKWIETTRTGVETILAPLLVGTDLDATRCDAVGTAPPTNRRSLDGEDFEFISINLDNMTLPGAAMARSLVTWCSAKRSDFSGAVFDYARVSGSDFTGANLEGASFRGVQAKSSKFTLAVFRDAYLDGVTFSGCDMRGATFSIVADPSAPALGARFVDCDLRESDWTRRPTLGVTFTRCRLEGARGLRGHHGDAQARHN